MHQPVMPSAQEQAVVYIGHVRQGTRRSCGGLRSPCRGGASGHRQPRSRACSALRIQVARSGAPARPPTAARSPDPRSPARPRSHKPVSGRPRRAAGRPRSTRAVRRHRHPCTFQRIGLGDRQVPRRRTARVIPSCGRPGQPPHRRPPGARRVAAGFEAASPVAGAVPGLHPSRGRPGAGEAEQGLWSEQQAELGSDPAHRGQRAAVQGLAGEFDDGVGAPLHVPLGSSRAWGRASTRPARSTASPRLSASSRPETENSDPYRAMDRARRSPASGSGSGPSGSTWARIRWHAAATSAGAC